MLGVRTACNGQKHERKTGTSKRALLLDNIKKFLKISNSILSCKYFKEYYRKPRKFRSYANQKRLHSYCYQKWKNFTILSQRRATALIRFGQKMWAVHREIRGIQNFRLRDNGCQWITTAKLLTAGCTAERATRLKDSWPIDSPKFSN
jgi:hypothetical protein